MTHALNSDALQPFYSCDSSQQKQLARGEISVNKSMCCAFDKGLQLSHTRVPLYLT
jgi:hypothetical protein